MYKTIKKIAIPNRGEIAVRLIATCREMGIEPILLYSSVDQNSLAYRLSSKKICIGPAESRQSYLNIRAVIEGALSTGADAIHPGYGFLSEKVELAKACRENNIIFIGPPENCLEIFGDKVRARKQAIKLGLPVLPACTVSVTEKPRASADHSSTDKMLLQSAHKIGFPVMIKAVGGGGGRGLRVVHSEEEWEEAFSSAQREAGSSFGLSEVFIEKYLPFARHIEVQVFGDILGRVFHLFERDCSLQRKHQKVIEEAPALLPDSIKQEMSLAAVELLQSVGYVQAGTVEFLYHEEKFYFMEVNPRIQVECPVTEMILGIDLIKAQILTAQGQAPFIQKELKPRGHSIQCRLYAEDMQKQIPVFGSLAGCHFPQGVNRRFDMGYESGDIVPGFYDAMLGKLIVWEENRARGIEKMKQALGETIIFGLKTNLSFLQDILFHEKFVTGNTHTRFLEEEFLKLWKEEEVESVNPEILSHIRRVISNRKSLDNLEENQWESANIFNPWTHFKK